MKIIWTSFAEENLREIAAYYSEVANKKVAAKIIKRIFFSTRFLLKNPEIGQWELSLEKEKYRYILSTNYKIIYRIDRNSIIITDIFDTRQHPENINNPKRRK